MNIEKICSRFLEKWISLQMNSFCVTGTVNFFLVAYGCGRGMIVLKGGTKLFFKECGDKLEIEAITNKIGKSISLQSCKFFLCSDGRCEKASQVAQIKNVGAPELVVI